LGILESFWKVGKYPETLPLDMNKVQVSRRKREDPRSLHSDVKATVSLLRRQEYERLLEHPLDLRGLRVIENQVGVDSRLTQQDRNLLLAAVSTRFSLRPIG